MNLQAHVDVDGADLYCEVAEHGPIVVLIHGFTLDTQMWDDQFLPLAKHFQVVRFDMRGFGCSTLPTHKPYSHVDDLSVMLERLNIGQAYLVGLSKGSAVALDFALAYPQRTQALVLIDMALGGYQWSPEASTRART
jgi:3-oxoadipate enol-lactonase